MPLRCALRRQRNVTATATAHTLDVEVAAASMRAYAERVSNAFVWPVHLNVLCGGAPCMASRVVCVLNK